MFFNLFGSNPDGQEQDEGGTVPGGQPYGANDLLARQPDDGVQSVFRTLPGQPEPHPDDPPSLDEYPYGRPPLTPEQSRRGYAKLFGVDPSALNADRLGLERPDAWQPLRSTEDTGHDGNYSMDTRFGYGGSEAGGDGSSFQARQTAYSGQASRQDDGGNASTASGQDAPAARQLADNAQYGAVDGGGGSESNSQTQGDGSKQPSSYSRKLTDKEKYYLRGAGYDDDLLDNITIHSGKSHPVLAFSRQSAVTPNANEIYMRAGVDKPDSTDLDDLEFLAHELHHAVQYQNGMTKWGYVFKGDSVTHDDNKYEKEAMARAAQAREAIKQLRLQEIRKEYGANPDGTFDN